VEKLKLRKEQRRNPAQIVQEALHWGTPVLDSALTLITKDHIYYRGRDAVELATTHSVEEVAALMWTGDLTAKIDSLEQRTDQPGAFPRLMAARSQLQGVSIMGQFQALLPLAAFDDLAAYDLQPAAVIETGGRILRLMTAIATGREILDGRIVAALRESWVPDDAQAAELLNASLILCADHELNVSSFSARCIASAAATPYQVVIGGLAALQGAKHGRMADRVIWLLKEVGHPTQARKVIGERLKRGEPIPGFGHPLYAGADPRARYLFEQVTTYYAHLPEIELILRVVKEAESLLGKFPTIDFGLVAVASALQLPLDRAIILFSLGRTIGWIGHALETYQSGRIIRPRARYVGQLP
jgi:citrate synthase